MVAPGPVKLHAPPCTRWLCDPSCGRGTGLTTHLYDLSTVHMSASMSARLVRTLSEHTSYLRGLWPLYREATWPT
jgi:hypothetical protein